MENKYKYENLSGFYTKKEIELKTEHQLRENTHINSVIDCLNSLSSSTKCLLNYLITDVKCAYDAYITATTENNKSELILEHKVKSNLFYSSLFLLEQKYLKLIEINKNIIYSNSSKNEDNIYICFLNKFVNQIKKLDISKEFIQRENVGNKEKIQQNTLKLPKKWFYHFKKENGNWILKQKPLY